MIPYTPEELDRLEALAEAATPGPWRESGRGIDQLTDAGRGYPLDVYPDSKEIVVSNWSESGTNGVLAEADAAFIAAFHPEAVRRLLAQVRAAEARWEGLDTWLDSKMITAHTAGESSYVAGAIDMRELTQAEMARLERE